MSSWVSPIKLENIISVMIDTSVPSEGSQSEAGEQGALSRGETTYMNVESSAQKGGLPHERLRRALNKKLLRKSAYTSRHNYL